MLPGGQHILDTHLGVALVDTRVNNDLIQSHPSLSHYIIVMQFGLDRILLVGAAVAAGLIHLLGRRRRQPSALSP